MGIEEVTVDGIEYVKRKMRIEEEKDIKILRDWTLTLLSDLKSATCRMDGKWPNNYRIVLWTGKEWLTLEDGTKDFCVGYYNALSQSESYLGSQVVVSCGNFVCFPEDIYGAELESPPSDDWPRI